IQWWEGAALSRAETVLQGTTQDTVRAEIGYSEKVSQRLWSKKVEEGIGLTARQRDAQRLEVPRVFGLERVVSCRSADPWWRTKPLVRMFSTKRHKNASSDRGSNFCSLW